MKKSEIREMGGFRKGTKLEKLAVFLIRKAGTPVKLERVAKEVHGKNGKGKGKVKDPVQATRNILLGLNRHVKDHGLPYQPVRYGRDRDGTSITITLPQKN